MAPLTTVHQPSSHRKSVRSGWPVLTLVIPSWVLSVGFHALVLVFLTQYLVLKPPATGLKEEFGREVGLILESPVVSPDSETLTPSESTEAAPEELETTLAPPVESVTSKMPPVPLASQPVESAPSTLGAGPVPLSGATDNRPPVSVVQSSESLPPPRAKLGDAIPGASFMGAQDRGSRIVFVIDCSGSMANMNLAGVTAMRVAKSELVASLQQLDSSQQFQILFYSENTRLMSGRTTKPDLMFATDINKTLARQYISSVPAEGGTLHLPALKAALALSPEVIFFLTDADEPQLTSGELAQVARWNGGKTHIHCIEFGKGGELANLENFLKKLARQNGGTYRYNDVEKFRN